MENADDKVRAVADSGIIRFGPFEIDRRTGEVRKFGVRLKLARQPLEVLLLLIERAGELVTREELQQRLWPQDVFVDFERSLNSAVKKLRGALGDNPDVPRYIETHPRKGYRFIGQILGLPEVAPGFAALVSDVNPPSVDASAANESPHAAIAARSHLARRTWALLVLLIVAAGLYLALRHRAPRLMSEAPPSKKPNVRSSIAILGFQNLTFQHESDWLGTAIVQMLATELQTGGKLRIIPDEAVTRAKADLNLKQKDGYPRDTLRELHKDLATDYVVAGSYVALGDRNSGQVRLDLRLQETISGETLASIAVSGKQSEIFELIKTAGKEMRAKVGGTIGPEGDADWRAALPSNPEAARLYSEGVRRMRVADNVSASEALEQSVALEPQFALAHSALAETWQALGYDSRAAGAAHKAMSLAASLPENVRLKVEGQYYESQRDWVGAIAAYRHLFQDYPDDLEAGLKLAGTQLSAGQFNDASSTISSLRSIDTADRPDPRIDLLEALVAARNSDFKGQQELARSAEKKAEVSGSRLLLARAKMVEGWALDDQTLLDSALQAYRAAQPVFEGAKDVGSTATLLDDIGIVLEKKGDLKGARDSLAEAQKRFRQIGDQNGLGSALTNLGELDHAEGDLANAEELYREALDIFRKSSRTDNEYATLNNLGGVLFERGEFRDAKKTFERVLQLRQAAGDKSGTSYAKTNLAAALWVQGQLDRSITLLDEALRTFREIGDPAGTASVESAYSRVLILKNDLPAARRALTDALKIDQEIGAKGDAAAARIVMAQVELAEGHAEQVDETTLRSSIDDLRSQHREGDIMEAFSIEIQAFLARGKLELAQQTLVRAKGLHNTTWLSNYHLMLASARVDAAQGKSETSRRKVAAARESAAKVGCGACEMETRLPFSRILAKAGA